MSRQHAAFALLLGLCIALATPPAVAQAEEERVTLLVSKAEPKAGKPRAKPGPQDKRAYEAVKKHAGDATGEALSMTKTEMWSVPKSKVEAVKKAAARFGLTITEVSEKSSDLFHFAPPEMKLTAKQRTMMDLAKSAKATMAVKLVMGPSPAMLEHALTRTAKDPSASHELAKIIVSVNEDTVLTIKRTSVDIRPDKAIWRGTVESTGALVTLMWWPSGKVSGTVQHDGRMFAIRHLGGRAYVIVEMSDEQMPDEHAPMPERARTNDPNLRDDPLMQQGDASVLRSMIGKSSPAQATKQQLAAVPLPKPAPAETAKKVVPKKDAGKAGAPGKDVVIDVIVAYTKKAASHYADVKRELVELAIEEGNESFRNSGLGHIKLRLVHAYQTNYVEKGGHFDHVWRFADKGDGYMDEIHGLRDKYRGDVAVLIVDDASGCGLSTRVYADASEAFAVVHHACAVMTYSVAHEIGHLIGARHDLSMDTSTTPFPYGHGYVEGTWRDIMSYKQSCGGCPRLPVWSSPNLLVKGGPAGTPDQDNARVISEQAARVAAFR